MSRLLGFFTALPSVWRMLQCLRRYHDTRNIFPHLVNCGKYTAGIMFYVCLSLYRVNKTHELLALFIFFGALNAVYTSIWDLAMDWSLLNFSAKKPLLRTVLIYKYSWFYYFAMVIDPLIRFNWIVYAVLAHDLQHSNIISFIVAVTEVSRRGIWTLIRVENEQQANQTKFRASRDIPLPYELDNGDYTPAALEDGPTGEQNTPSTPGSHHLAPVVTGSEHSRPTPSLRNRRTLESPINRALSMVGARVHMAHTEDFERRRPDIVSMDADSSDDEADDQAMLPQKNLQSNKGGPSRDED
jgi:hypothetical protein